MKKSRLFMLWMAVLIALLLAGAALFFTGMRDYAVKLTPPQGGALDARLSHVPFL